MTKLISTNKKKQKKEYDSAWKDVIEELFTSFLDFFFPEIHADIDFSRKYEFLSKELRSIAPDNNVGKRFADELVKVYLKDGSVKYICILIHIEVQGSPDENFMERMHVYNYRIYDRHRKNGLEVVSLAVLTDKDVNYRPDEYCVKRWGFEHRLKIPIIKIIDYKVDEDKKKILEETDNPMAMIVQAQLRSFEFKTRENKKKFDIKIELIRQCYKKGYNKEQIRTLLKFIDWIIRLPEDLQEELSKEITFMEEEYKMAYVTSWERMGVEKGIEQGIGIGVEKGIEQGIGIGVEKGIGIGVEKGILTTAERMLKGNLPIERISEFTGLSTQQIKKIAKESTEPKQ